MGFRIGDVYLALLADDARLKPQVEKAAQEAGDAGAKTLGQRLKAGLTPERIGTALGAAFGGIAAAGIKMGEKVDVALDTIRTGTGATGDALRGLEDDFKAVSGRVPDDIEQIGQVIADLNTRTGQTGEGLQDLAVTILDFSRITKSDVNANVRNATRLFGDWSVATEDQAATLDKVYRASQATGISVDTLMQTVVDFGSPLRLLGFGMEESIALLSKWEKEGVNTETALTGLKFSVKTLAREGVPASKMAETLRAKIDAIGKSTDPVSDAIKLFGLRAGPDLAAAILEGRFETEELLDVINNGSDTIAQGIKDTDGLGEAWKRFTNTIQTNFGGLFTAFAGLGNLVYLIPAITGGIGKALGKAWTAAAGSGAVKGAVAAAGNVASTAYLKALIVGDAISGQLSGAWAKVANSPAMQGAIGKAGRFMGTTLGKATAVAFGAALAAEAVVLWLQTKEELDRQGKALADQTTEFAKTATRAQLEAALATAEEQSRQLLDTNLLVKAIPGLGPLLQQASAGATEELQRTIDTLKAQIAQADVGESMTRDIGDGIIAGTGEVERAGDDMMAKLRAAVPGTVAKEAGQQIPQDIASGISERQSFVQSAMNNLRDLMENVLGRKKRIGLVIGDLISADLQKALHDRRWRVRNAAEQTEVGLVAELEKAISKGGKVGEDAMEALRKALRSKDPQIRAAAQHVKDIIDGKLDRVVTSAGNAGQDAGEAFAARLRRAIATGDFTVNASVGFSLPGRAVGGPVVAGMPYKINERTPRSEVMVPSTSGYVMTHADAVRAVQAADGGGGGDTINVPINLTGYLKAETPGELTTRLRQVAAGGVLSNPQRSRRVEVRHA